MRPVDDARYPDPVPPLVEGFESDENQLTLISNHGQSIIFEKEDKISLAKKILDLVYP